MNTRDFESEARKESEQSDAIKLWVQERVRALRERVTAHDVLRRFGVKLRHSGDRTEQFSCPFHGKDNRPSARVYPESPKGPSHVWCFVCQKNWDCINLWKQFSGHDGRFTALLREIEKAYGILPPEAPNLTRTVEMERQTEAKAAYDEVIELFSVCDRRLRHAKASFEMRAFLTIGSLLDQTYFAFSNGTVDAKEATRRIRKLLDKVGEKERGSGCPDV